MLVNKRKSAARQSVKLVHAGLDGLAAKSGGKSALLDDASIRNSVAVQEAIHGLSQAVAALDDQSSEEEKSPRVSLKGVLGQSGGPSSGSTRSLIAASSQLEEVKAAAEQVVAEAPREKSKVQFRPVPKLVKSPAPNASDHSIAKLTRHDMLFGETATIDGLWIYDYAINVEALRAGLERFLGEVPMLAGRMDKGKGGLINTNQGVPLYVQYANGSHLDMDEDPSPRSDWVDKPPLPEIWEGKAPLMTVVLTLLRDGGSVLGVYVSHGAAGGAGWFGTCMPRFAAMVKAAHAAKSKSGARDLPPLPEAGLGSVVPNSDRSMLPSGRYSKQEIEKMVRSELPYKQLDFTDPLIGESKRRMYYWLLTLATDRPRVLVHFSPQELENIKKAALDDCGGRVDWLSTGEALAAHLSRVVDSIAPVGNVRFTHIACIVDHVGFLKHLPKGVMANTFYLYSAQLESPANKMSIGDIAQVLHNRMREITKDPEEMVRQMDLQEDVLANRYQPSPNLDGAIALVLNNQSKFKPLLQLDFGEGVSYRYVPHPAGDSLLFCPAKDGGIDCWISTVNGIIGNPERLREQRFMDMIHQFK